MTDYYKLLGVTKNASADEIKKAYRTAALKHHPDRGGDAETFSNIGKAYEVLSDADKKRLYDLGGADAVERGNGGGRRAAPKMRKTDPVTSSIKISLEDIYSGSTRKLKITRSVCCTSCKGLGGTVTTCTPCQGRGTRTVVQRVGPNMVSQQQTTCTDCRGTGTSVKAGNHCVQCRGQATSQESKQFVVDIPKGAQQGQSVRFIGDGDQLPNTLAGDIIIKFDVKEHPKFQRDGFHLIYNQTLSLFQALCGVSFYIEHLDGHQVLVPVNNVIKPGDVITIPNQGLPHSHGPGKGEEYGNLYVKFNVEFPTNEHMNAIKTKAPQFIPFLYQTLPQQSYCNTTKPTGPTVEAMGIVTPTQVRYTTMEQEERLLGPERRKWEALKQEQDKQNQSTGNDFDDEHDDHEMAGQSMGGCQQM